MSLGTFWWNDVNEQVEERLDLLIYPDMSVAIHINVLPLGII